LAEGEIKNSENKIPDEFDRWKQMQQRQIEMNKIPTPEKTYTTMRPYLDC